jgi:hypothetical protein
MGQIESDLFVQCEDVSKVTCLCSSSKKFTAEHWSKAVGSANKPEAVVNATKLLLANDDQTLRIPTSEWRTTLQSLRSDGACCYQVLRLALSVPSLANDIDEGCLHIVAISCIQSARAATDKDEARRLFEKALEVINVMQTKRFTQGTTTAYRAIIHAASVAQCPEVVDRALSMQSEAICAGVLSKYVGVMPKSPTSTHQPPNKSMDLSQPQLFLDLEPSMASILDPTTPATINGIPMPPASPYVKPQYVMPPQDKTSAPQQGHKYQPPAAFTFIQPTAPHEHSSDAFSDDEETHELKQCSDDELFKGSDDDYSEELSNVMPWRVSSDDDYSSDDTPSA